MFSQPQFETSRYLPQGHSTHLGSPSPTSSDHHSPSSRLKNAPNVNNSVVIGVSNLSASELKGDSSPVVERYRFDDTNSSLPGQMITNQAPRSIVGMDSVAYGYTDSINS